MARVSTYLNFTRSTEAAFVFYKSVSELNSPHQSPASKTFHLNRVSLLCPIPQKSSHAR